MYTITFIIFIIGEEFVDFEMFKTFCEDLDRAQKLATTPITAITETKEERRRSRRLSSMNNPMRKLSTASQSINTMKVELERIEASDASE